MLTIEYIEDEETIRLIVHKHDGRDPETFYLDADDMAWELTLDDSNNVTEFRTDGG